MSTFSEWLFSLQPPKVEVKPPQQGAWIPEHPPKSESFVVEFTQQELDEIDEDARILAGIVRK